MPSRSVSSLWRARNDRIRLLVARKICFLKAAARLENLQRAAARGPRQRGIYRHVDCVPDLCIPSLLNAVATQPIMRKRILTRTPTTAAVQKNWLDLERAATVEVTSEDKDFPIESSLSLEPGKGWRAAEPGTQTIRLVFDGPQELKHISLVFEESQMTRTQEFVLRASSKAGAPFREIVRQQWNFSAPTSTREIEEYCVHLSNVAVLELTIVPDISGGNARASLKSLHLSREESSSVLTERGY